MTSCTSPLRKSTAKTDIFTVAGDGRLLLWEMDVRTTRLFGPILLDQSIVQPRFTYRAPWNRYLSLSAGSGGSLYAVDTDGSLLYYRVEPTRTGRRRLASREPLTISSGAGPGSGWDGVDHFTAGAAGSLYVVRSDGRLGYYRHVGYSDGTARLASSAELTLPGSWSAFAHVFAGDDGDLLASRRRAICVLQSIPDMSPAHLWSPIPMNASTAGGIRSIEPAACRRLMARVFHSAARRSGSGVK